jgi:hypothetical protein
VQSNPVSGSILQKMGILPISHRDFRLSGESIYQIGNVETLPQGTKSANSGLSCDIGVKLTRDRTAWLAPQCRSRPALPDFPANREFYREFFRIAAARHLRDPNILPKAQPLVRNSLVTKEGIISE